MPKSSPVDTPASSSNQPPVERRAWYAFCPCHGMNFGAWRDLIRGRLHLVAPRLYPTLVTITVCTVFNSIFLRLGLLLHRRRFAQTKISPDPVFILGHWRSGTTWLHELLACDSSLAAPTHAQVFTPSSCLLFPNGTLGRPGRRPTKRPMDNVQISAASPQEDEWALSLSGCDLSWVSLGAFPGKWGMLSNTTGAGVQRPEATPEWRGTWLRILKQIQFANPGKRLLLKSPRHTTRLPTILEMFPNAKFVHVVRDPYRVFQSTRRLHVNMSPVMSLDDKPIEAADLNARILTSYVEMQERFLTEKHLIPKGNLISLQYEDLRADTLSQMRRIYDGLDLGDFESVLPALRTKIEADRSYQTNKFEISDDLEEVVFSRWQKYFDLYGYKRLNQRDGQRI